MGAPEFFSALLMIILINLVLSGDNAVVIAVASRKLAKRQRTKAIVIGTLLAVLVRVLATIAAAYLLQIPFLYMTGGMILVWIAYRLLIEGEDEETIASGENLRQAVRTIVIADLMMGVDNVIAIAGAAKGNVLLIALGLLASVPLIIFGSQLILRAMERFPWIVYFGSGVLALAAANMILHETTIHAWVKDGSWGALLFKIGLIGAVLLFGKKQRDRLGRRQLKQA